MVHLKMKALTPDDIAFEGTDTVVSIDDYLRAIKYDLILPDDNDHLQKVLGGFVDDEDFDDVDLDDLHIIVGVDKNNNFHAAYFDTPIEDLNRAIDMMENDREKSRFMVIPFTRKIYLNLKLYGLDLSKGVMFISGKPKLPFIDRRKYTLLLDGDEEVPSLGDYVLFQAENTLLSGWLVEETKVKDRRFGIAESFSSPDKTTKRKYKLPLETMIKVKQVINDNLVQDVKVSPELIAKVILAPNTDKSSVHSIIRLFNKVAWETIISEMRKMV